VRERLQHDLGDRRVAGVLLPDIAEQLADGRELGRRTRCADRHARGPGVRIRGGERRGGRLPVRSVKVPKLRQGHGAGCEICHAGIITSWPHRIVRARARFLQTLFVRADDSPSWTPASPACTSEHESDRSLVPGDEK
jgi:hypothetical protein